MSNLFPWQPMPKGCDFNTLFIGGEMPSKMVSCRECREGGVGGRGWGLKLVTVAETRERFCRNDRLRKSGGWLLDKTPCTTSKHHCIRPKGHLRHKGRRSRQETSLSMRNNKPSRAAAMARQPVAAAHARGQSLQAKQQVEAAKSIQSTGLLLLL